MSMPLPSGATLDIAGTQFVLLGAAHTYAITFSCAAKDATCADTADAAIATFDFV